MERQVVEQATPKMVEAVENAIAAAFGTIPETYPRLAGIVACIRMAIVLAAVPCLCPKCVENVADVPDEIRARNAMLLHQVMGLILPDALPSPAETEH